MKATIDREGCISCGLSLDTAQLLKELSMKASCSI